MVAFVLFAAIVYLLPRSRINAEVDTDLHTLADELKSANVTTDRDGTVRFEIGQDLDDLETAASFFMIVDTSGGIGLRSQNMGTLSQDFGLLDENGFHNTDTLNYVVRGDSTLRVLTSPCTTKTTRCWPTCR